MKTKKSTIFFILFVLLGTSFISCKDDINEVKKILVEKVQLNDDLKQGLTVEMGVETINVSGKVTVFPEDAPNQKESYASSNEHVATVNEEGMITIHAIGKTTITVTVDGKSDYFLLTVITTAILVSEIQVENTALELGVGEDVNLATQMTVLPEDADHKQLIYESDDETIVQVDESGSVAALAAGTANITITSVSAPSVQANVQITVTEVIGDYARDLWTVSASHPLFDGDGNFLTGAIDGDPSTIFALVRPGKSFKDISVPNAASGGNIYFVIDMKEQRKVNYFRIRHRDDRLFLRYMMIEEISGSNDGENFETIATDVVITGGREDTEVESPDISIPTSNYRYLKFFFQKNECFYSISQGASAQLSEFYLGNE